MGFETYPLNIRLDQELLGKNSLAF
jgi:hypothetical protein